MFKATIRHEHLKKSMNEVMDASEDNLTDEMLERLANELKYSCLIAAGNFEAGKLNLMTAQFEFGHFGLLFTDMDEFRKVFPGSEVDSHEHLFYRYKQLAENSTLEGFIINFAGEGYILPRAGLEVIGDIDKSLFSTDGGYSKEELKSLRASADNSALESFIANPENAYDYEGLFDLIADSVLFTLLVSEDNLRKIAHEGTVEMDDAMFESVRLYIGELNGSYATAYTKEKKMEHIPVRQHRYSQIVNFAYLANFALADDLDGIIINPNSEHMVIDRDVLLEFSDVIEKKCSNGKLASAIEQVYLMDGEIY